MYSDHLTWWFEQVGYSPLTDWSRLISVPISVRVRPESLDGLDSAIDAAISSTVQEYSEASTAGQQVLHGELHVTSEYEPAGEFIAGVIVTVLGKLVVSIFCTIITGGGPWLVIWLTTALTSQWYPRDFGGLRGGRTCVGTGRHVHDKEKCRLKFLDTACVTSAGSEHSRILGVILAAVGWGIGRASYSFIPQISVLLTITEWDSTVGFAVGNASLIGVCLIGLLTISYQTPKKRQEKYFLYRIGLEWGVAIVAIAVGITPVVVTRNVRTGWMLVDELIAWIIDAITTLFVVGTYPDCISAWHSVWVLVPALLSGMAGALACWN
jgi:hypothetical protein